MLRVYSVIYCSVMALFLLVMLVANFLVGAAGHNPPTEASEYFVVAYCIVAPICLISYLDCRNRTLRYINMALVSLAAVSMVYIMAEMLTEDEFVFIPFAICLLFILLCSALLRALLKN